MKMSPDENIPSPAEERMIAAGIADSEAGRVIDALTVFADVRTELIESRRSTVEK